MTIREFIKMTQENQVNIAELISVKKYISVAEKIRLAKSVMDFCVKYDGGFIEFDSLKKHLAFTLDVIEAHTDLRFSDDWSEKIQAYDSLCEADLIEAIIDEFKKDYDECQKILNMMRRDILADNSVEASVAKISQSIAENLDVLAGLLADKIGNIDVENIIPNDLDLDKIKGLLDKIK